MQPKAVSGIWTITSGGEGNGGVVDDVLLIALGVITVTVRGNNQTTIDEVPRQCTELNRASNISTIGHSLGSAILGKSSKE